MGVGIEQLEEVFHQAEAFDRDPGALNQDSLERNLIGVLDDFKNLRGNDARLTEMDQKLYDLIQPIDFDKPGLRVIISHFLTTLFENYANEGRGHRKGYELSQDKRTTSSIDGPFIYDELLPAIFDEAALQDADRLRYYLVHGVSRFLEDKDPGGHWRDDQTLESVREARTDTLLLELGRRRVRHSDVPNLAQKAHTLEQRLAEAGFFQEAASVRRALGYFFERHGYIAREGFWARLRKRLAALGRGRATFGRLSRWKMVYRAQLAYMVVAVILVILTIAFWGWRQGQQVQILERYYQEAGRVE
jgi:hypothetical protein